MGYIVSFSSVFHTPHVFSQDLGHLSKIIPHIPHRTLSVCCLPVFLFIYQEFELFSDKIFFVLLMFRGC